MRRCFMPAKTLKLIDWRGLSLQLYLRLLFANRDTPISRRHDAVHLTSVDQGRIIVL